MISSITQNKYVPIDVEKQSKYIAGGFDDFLTRYSVYDEKTVSKTNPFGKGVSKALQYIEALAKKDGFKVTNYDNKVIE